MQRSDQIDQLATALAKAQGAMTSAEKDGKGNYGKYASLAAIWDAIRAPLSVNGLSVTQTMSMDDGRPILETTLMHASGQWETSCVPILAKDGSPQQFGSGLTYARRYGLAPIVGIAADDDDDGEAAQKGFQQQQRTASRPQTPTEAAKPQPVATTTAVGNGKDIRPMPTTLADAYKQGAQDGARDPSIVPGNGNGHTETVAAVAAAVAAAIMDADEQFGQMESAGDAPINDALRKAMFAQAKKVYGNDMLGFRNWIHEQYQVDTTNALTIKQATEIINKLRQEHEPPKMPQPAEVVGK